MGTKLKHSTASHPPTNGQTEVTNQTFETLLRTLIKPHLKAWDLLVHHTEFAYNRTPSKVTGMSPFKVAYGIDPLSPLDLVPQPTDQKPNIDVVKCVKDI